MYITSEIMAKLESMGIEPKKSLGQNFLVSQNVINRIIQKVKDHRPEKIIEIGPGLGSLTESLLQLQLPLQLIELDRTFAQYWRTRQQDVIEGDALKWDWNRLKDAERTLLVSNLPYQISSSLVIDRSIQKTLLSGMVLMFQKEVAERLLAKPKTEAYGLLSVIAQNFWSMEIVADAGPKDFYPPPRIASRVISFKPRNDYQGVAKEFLTLVKTGFSQRRKFLLSNLRSLGNAPGDELMKEIFLKLNISPQCRAEELSIEQWRELSYQLSLVRRKEVGHE